MTGLPDGLTPLEFHTLHVIAELIEKNGYSPSYSEILAELDLKSKSGVARLIGQLEDKGWLHRRMHGAQWALAIARELPPLPEHEVELTGDGRAYLAGRAAS